MGTFDVRKAISLQFHCDGFRIERGMRGIDMNTRAMLCLFLGSLLICAGCSTRTGESAQGGSKRLQNGGESFAGQDLRFAKFGNRDLKGADLTKANLSAADLKKADLSGAVLRGAQFGVVVLNERSNHTVASEADFTGADLREALFVGTVLRNCIFDKADFRGAQFQTGKIHGVVILGTDFTNSTFRGANLAGVIIKKVAISNTIWDGANLRGASFDCLATNVDLSRANLQDADLSGLKVFGDGVGRLDPMKFIKLNGALYSKGTKWPEWLNPKQAGAVLAE